ncbi:hypothetical protein VTP01DRAFT_5768 [Rhizomucor pusillus]|uniref:uncharacterized protein n=1 Tax=Rhizomucor pusillus TaxID=4840 RepID=UPI0037439BEA
MTQPQQQAPTIVSAPGKVLLTGGYLVLDQKYQGLVVGTTARFFTSIRNDQGLSPGTIRVEAPQFTADNVWEYSIRTDEEDQLVVEKPEAATENKFVEACIRFSLAVIYHRTKNADIVRSGLSIVIVGDNDFYSQRSQLEQRGLPLTVEGLEALDRCCDTGATLKTVHKTGLGSSAALTTSLIAALFVHLGAASLDNDNDRLLIHNTAQFVHCYAQGKVGSGFDVSAAVWGNHRYTRFSPQVLSPIMSDKVNAEQLAQALEPSDNSSWDNAVVPFQLPPQLELILGDVDAGSHTPTLVGKVLSWRKEKAEEANTLWDELGNANASVEQDLRTLAEIATANPDGYANAISKCATMKAAEWSSASGTCPVTKTLVQLAQDFKRVRGYLQRMSVLSNVPIEPEEQTRLLDACMDMPGVVMAGVPGAGGYDAIFCIVLSQEAKENVRKLWTSWKEMDVSSLLAQADNKGAMQISIDTVKELEYRFQ